MRIAFDATSCAKERRGGIASYGWGLVSGLKRVAADNEYLLTVRPNRLTKRRHLADMGLGRPRLLVSGAPGLTLGKLDVLHGLGVHLPVGGDFRKVVTLHDINVFEYPDLASPHWRERRQARIRQTLERTDLVISFSEQGRRALGELLDVPPERVRVVPCGVDIQPPDDAWRDAVLAGHELHDRPFVFNVGALSPRKNQMGLLEAFARAGLPGEWVLVLGGPRGENADPLRRRAAELGLDADRVRLPGWIAEDELPALLAGCAMYACASLHEGFGIPVIEAQACGAPVISSNRGALPETVGDCGLIFDPLDAEAFADAIATMASDEARRAELRREGPRRAREVFAWDRIARLTLQVYQDAVELDGR